jgi:NADPH:quinone reductase-like Zn-dependent oxidoreductase
VKQIVQNLKSDGLMPTIDAVFKRADEPLTLGYCNAGVVAETGPGVTGFQVGDRVASNGKHAEFVCVPENLCAKVPEDVTDEEAAFTVIGAIGLQGIRLCAPGLGETVLVVALKLKGFMPAGEQTCGCLQKRPSSLKRNYTKTHYKRIHPEA